MEKGYRIWVSMPKGTTMTRRLAACSVLHIGRVIHPSAYSLTGSARNF